MNLLAHAVLSPDDELVRVGNVVADFIHRNEVASLDLALQRGIALHQVIDRFTDNHPVVQRSHERLVGFRRYSNPLVDVFYDHFLSLHWPKPEPLELYVVDLYRSIEHNFDRLPEDCVAVCERLILDDWMTQYGTFDGLRVNLSRMQRRIEWSTGRTVDLVSSLQILETHHDAFEQDFLEFWPELTAECEAHRAEG